MISQALSLSLLLAVMAGCTPVDNSESAGCAPTNTLMEQSPSIPMGKAKYERLYFDYRTLITEAINNTNGVNLYRVTNEYITKTKNIIVSIRVSKMDSMGNWKVVLSTRDQSRDIVLLPKIHYKLVKNKRIHVNKIRGGFVLCASSMTTNRTYSDNIHIRMVIEPEFRKFLNEFGLPGTTPID